MIEGLDRPPKDYEGNIRFRANLLNIGLDSPYQAAAIREFCKQDILWFFNAYLWAEDPFVEKGLRHGVTSARTRPVVTYKFQDDFILGLKGAIDKGEDFVRDKSRDMLATYMVLGTYLHGFLFEGRKFLITSWKEDEIDGKEDTSTHFGKLRFNLRQLPYFIMPAGWDWKRNSSYMKLQNPETGATLTGSAASASLASGRREDSVFMDELSKWEKHDSDAWASVSDATKCKVAVFTPHGSGNKAAELMRGTEVKNKGSLIWYLHPEKTFTTPEHLAKVMKGEVYDKVRKYIVQYAGDQSKSPFGCYIDNYGRIRSEWYDRECNTRDADDIAENLDCDYLTTGRPIFDTNICSLRKTESVPPKFVGDLIWRSGGRPQYDTYGQCTNRGTLSVEFVPNVNGLVWVWDKPVDTFENAYVIGADTAEGLEQGDYDASYVLGRYKTKPFVVARLHAHIKMHEYADELAKLGTYYGNAYVGCESNNHGHAVLQELVKLYPFILAGDVYSKGYAKSGDKLGFTTGSVSRPIIIGTLQKAIALNEFDCPDEAFWGECMTFVEDDGRMEAQGKHRGDRCYDDRVLSMAIMLWSHLKAPLPSQKQTPMDYPSWVRKPVSKMQGHYVGWSI